MIDLRPASLSVHAAWATVVLLTLGACSSIIEGQPYPERASFKLTVPAAHVDGDTESLAAPANAAVLQVAAVRIEAPFDSRSFQYRTDTDRYEADYYNRWAGPPARLLAESVREALARSGQFSTVIDETSGIAPHLTLELTVSALHVDTVPVSGAEAPGTPESVIAVRAVLVAASGSVLEERRLAAREPVRDGSGAAAVEAWNRALERIVADLVDMTVASLDPSATHRDAR